jgi:ribosomal protein S18 acetylase RimI-like enzyme
MSEHGTIEIRDANLRDAPALVPLFTELGHPSTEAELRMRLPLVQDAGDRVLVAARGSALLGFAVVHLTPALHRATWVGRITAIAVSRDAQGTGVGRRLVEAAEEIVTAAGARRIEVTSAMRRTGAHGFYRGLGYSDTGIRFTKDVTAPPETPESQADGVRTPSAAPRRGDS